jgi:diacylglycerol kinase (ATP)
MVALVVAAPLKILFCVNPGAGPKRNIDWSDLIRTWFEGRVHQPLVLFLPKGDAQAAIADAVTEHAPDRVVAVGGDGTVVMVARVVGGTGLPMAIIPAGSANGLATDMEIPMDPDRAVDRAVNGTAHAIDAIEVNGQDLCLHLGDLGLNAQLIHYYDQVKERGMFTYARLSLKVLLNRKRFIVRMAGGGGGTVVRSAFMVVLANARRYGTGATINKIGRLDDGLFEVVLVRRFDLRELWVALSRRQRYDPRRVEVFQVREVWIRTLHATHFQLDGDHKGRTQNVHARVLPSFIQLVH